MALHAGLMSLADLNSLCLSSAHRVGVASLRRVAYLADPAAESPMETRLRMVLVTRRATPPPTHRCRFTTAAVGFSAGRISTTRITDSDSSTTEAAIARALPRITAARTDCSPPEFGCYASPPAISYTIRTQSLHKCAPYFRVDRFPVPEPAPACLLRVLGQRVPAPAGKTHPNKKETPGLTTRGSLWSELRGFGRTSAR
jgi:hypothetical protein